MRGSGRHFRGYSADLGDDWDELKKQGRVWFCRPTLGVVGSGGAGLAAAGQIGHYAGGDGGQGVGGWFGDGDGLEGEVLGQRCTCAPGGEECTRGIELADGVVAGIHGVEVARGIKRQAIWAAQIRVDLA